MYQIYNMAYKVIGTYYIEVNSLNYKVDNVCEVILIWMQRIAFLAAIDDMHVLIQLSFHLLANFPSQNNVEPAQSTTKKQRTQQNNNEIDEIITHDIHVEVEEVKLFKPQCE